MAIQAKIKRALQQIKKRKQSESISNEKEKMMIKEEGNEDKEDRKTKGKERRSNIKETSLRE